MTDTWKILDEFKDNSNDDFGILLFDKRGRPTAVAMYPGEALHYYARGDWKWANYAEWDSTFQNTVDSFDLDAPTFADAIPNGFRVDLSRIDLNRDLGEFINKKLTIDVIRTAVKTVNPNISPKLVEAMQFKLIKTSGKAIVTVPENNDRYVGTTTLRFHEAYICGPNDCYDATNA